MKQKNQTSALVTQNHLVLAIRRLSEQTKPLWVGDDLRQSLIEAEANLRQARVNLKTAQDTVTARADVRRRQGGVLVKTVRDFYHVLNRAANRDEDYKHWLIVFKSKSGLPKQKSLKHPWFELARGIAEANVKAQETLAADPQAFSTAPPSNPSADEVTVRLEQAEQADQAWRDATMALKEPAEALRQARDHGLQQLASLRLTLRAKMVGWSDEQRRKVLRMFGFDFITGTNADSDPPSTSDTNPSPNPPSSTLNQERASA